MNDNSKKGLGMREIDQAFDWLSENIQYSPDDGRFGVLIDLNIANSGGTVLAFQDREDQVGLLLPFGAVDRKSRFRSDTKSQHITLTATNYNGARYAQLQVESLLYHTVFRIFSNELVRLIQGDPELAVTIAGQLLAQWRQLFENAQRGRLSREQEIGLIGELETMIALTETDGDLSFYRWTGADRFRHDFSFDDRTIECKATTKQAGLSISVNGIRQLEAVDELPLILSVRKYEVSPSGRITLQGLINQLSNDARIPSNDFLTELANLGVDLRFDETQEPRRYNFVDCFTFDVTEDFPRIRPSEIDPRIIEAHYTLDLTDPESIPGFRQQPFPLS